jgi:hypothetical protein
LKDFIQEVKLLSKDNELTLPSTSSGSQSKPPHNRRLVKNKKIPLNEKHENSIDADESIDLELALNFPKDMEKYTDDIWRKTLSSDCDPSIHTPWEKQPEVNKTPSIVWPSTSSDEIYNPMRSHLFPDFWSGGNIFFPTNAPTTSTASTSTSRITSDSIRNQRKVPLNKNSEEDDFNNMKKKLSLSSLRSSLCRPNVAESTNSQANTTSALDDDDDFLQVFYNFILF